MYLSSDQTYDFDFLMKKLAILPKIMEPIMAKELCITTSVFKSIANFFAEKW
jgi:hypothetical protein